VPKIVQQPELKH